MDATVDFKTYLEGKKIDATRFQHAESEQYASMKQLFADMHPNSFTAQKLFLINGIRRKYHLDDKPVEQAAKPKMAARPKFKRPS